MGFTTGVLGGFTLTTSLLYLSLHLHRQNRLHQHNILQQQHNLLNSLVDPVLRDSLARQQQLAATPGYEIVRPSLSEMLKDRWNREIEEGVRNLQETDWAKVRERWETRAGEVWKRVVG